LNRMSSAGIKNSSEKLMHKSSYDRSSFLPSIIIQGDICYKLADIMEVNEMEKCLHLPWVVSRDAMLRSML
jgi:hypothetical protein